jgi:hypothetical protein
VLNKGKWLIYGILAVLFRMMKGQWYNNFELANFLGAIAAKFRNAR